MAEGNIKHEIYIFRIYLLVTIENEWKKVYKNVSISINFRIAKATFWKNGSILLWDVAKLDEPVNKIATKCNYIHYFSFQSAGNDFKYH